MINVIRHEKIEGRPWFTTSDPKPVQHNSFHSDNHLIKTLKPSQVKSKIRRIFERIIQFILSYLTVIRPDVMKEKLARIIRAGGSHSRHPSSVTVGQLWAHYKRFLTSDRTCPLQMRKCFDQLERDEAVLKNIQAKKARSKNPSPSVLKQQEQFIEKTLTDIRGLSEGTSRLFLLQREDDQTLTTNGKLFCVISKEKGNYTLRFVGKGQVMRELAHKGETIPLAGKEKVSRELCFENVPQKELLQNGWMKKLFKKWGKGTDIPTDFIQTSTEHLAPYKKALSSKHDLITCSDRVDHLFWNVIQACSLKKNPLTPLEQKRLKLRANLLSLYALFQDLRYDLKPHTANYRILGEVLKGVSTNIYLATQKGYLSLEETQAINQELAEIEKALQDAKKSPVSFPAKFPSEKTAIKRVANEKLRLQKRHEIQWVEEEWGHRTQGVLPSDEPVNLPGIESLSQLLYDQINSKEDFFTIFREMCKNVSNQSDSRTEQMIAIKDIQRLFNEVPYSMFQNNLPNKDCFWWNLTPEESIEVMEKINEYTKLFMDSISVTQISQYEYDSLIKMTRLVSFLNARTSGYWISEWDSYSFRTGDNFQRSVYRTQTDNLSAQFYRDCGGGWDSTLQGLLSYAMGMGKAFKWVKRKGGDKDVFSCGSDVNIKQIVTIPPQVIQWSKTQAHLIDPIHGHKRAFKKETTGWWADGSQFFQFTPLEKWLRPIQDPYLKALHKLVQTSVGHKLLLNPAYNTMNTTLTCPEAYQKEPENIFVHFLEEAQKERTESPAVPSALGHFTPDDMKQLLHVLRKDSPQVELIAFMKQSPHLMRYPDIRNFFDALFFDYFLDLHLIGKGKEIYNTNPNVNPQYFFNQIQEEIDSLEIKVNNTLQQKNIQDPKLLQERMDTLLYYYEMKEKLRLILVRLAQPTDYISSSTTGLEELYQLCQDRSELSSCLGHVARVQMRDLLNSGEADSSQILRNYAVIKGGSADPLNMDPYFEEELDRYWQEIVKQCATENPNLSSFLDQLCYAKDLPLDGSAWINQEGSIYQNSFYKVNLKTCEVSKINSKISIRFLPSWITCNPHFGCVMGEKATWRAKAQEVGNRPLFSLNDQNGRPVQIEQSQDTFTLYKKFDIEGGLWLQSIPKESLFAPSSTDSRDAASLNASLPFFDHGIYRDPKNPDFLYCVNEKGDICFKIRIKQTKNSLICQDITDYRSVPPTTNNHLTTASQIKSEAVDQLALFENTHKIILWSVKGRLTKVEFPRYNLSFVYEGGRLVCKQPAFNGYAIDLSATLQEKRGLPHALVLEHPDPTKPKKLLVPEANAITTGHETVYSQAHGVIKIGLYLKNLYDMYVNSKPLDVQQRAIYEIDSHRKMLAYRSFDIRPDTGEICQSKAMNVSASLELVKQALFLDKPALAQEMLKLLQLSAKTLNQELLNELTGFIQTPILGNGAEAALKIRLCLTIKRCLKKQKKLPKTLGSVFNDQMMKLGRQFYAQGRKIPKELQLTPQECTLLARLYQKNDLDYYETHVKVFFIAKGTEFNLLEPLQENETLTQELQEAQPAFPPTDINARILALEAEISPDDSLSDADLVYSIPFIDKEIPLIDFTTTDENTLFKEIIVELPGLIFDPLSGKTSCEKIALEEAQQAADSFKQAEKEHPRHLIQVTKKALNKFIHSKLVPQKIKWEEAIKKIRCAIEEMVRQSSDPKEQLAIYAGHQSIASFAELRKALGQDHLEALQAAGRLPSSLDISALRGRLIHFFETLSHRNAATAALSFANEIIAKGDAKNAEEWESMSEEFYRLLTIKRRYDAHQDPRLLIFEAQKFINFKPLDDGLDQIELLDALVKNPRGIIQAPTGAGKTSILSVMWSLLQANGNNLSILQVLPSLYQQTYDQLKSVLEDLYGTSLYALRFNLKMRMTISTTNAAGEKIEHSIFKGMYCELLETIKNKGCVLTDYKSLPLLEEMFFKVARHLVANDEQELEIDPVLEEHFTYLRKILILLKKKAKVNMDEFDQPNRPIQKIQLDLGVGSHPLPPFLIETSLEIFKILTQDASLGLLKNIQGDLSEETRQLAIRNAATTMANTLNEAAGNSLDATLLLEYLLGENEAILIDLQDLPLRLKDQIALCKEQFSTHLPLTLSYKEGSRYARSEEGTKIVPCYNGEKHDAKFGTILEQVNYAIQCYLQTGITKSDLKPWIIGEKQQWDDMEEGLEKELLLDNFHHILPDLSLFQAAQMLDKEETTHELIKRINADPTKVIVFLKKYLQTLHTSGDLISMDPQNIVGMSRAVSGISATMGAPESLPSVFEVDKETNAKIQAGMFYRLQKRAKRENVIAYDPEKPKEMLRHTDGIQIQAIIDGGGAFKNARAAAKALKNSNKTLKQVSYHQDDDSLAYVGTLSDNLNTTGFFFAQQRTRGTDVTLDPKTNAILTLGANTGMRTYCQNEGRLRQKQQRYFLAMSKYQKIKTITQEMGHAIAQDALVDAQDIFRKSKQELYAILRAGKKKRLLEAENPEDFIALFQQEKYWKAFISEGEPHYDQEGTYFDAHHAIRRTEENPQDVLNALKTTLIKEAQALGLDETAQFLEEIEYPDELLAKMPDAVAPLGAAQGELEQELQIEQEEECEAECELEFETEQNLENVRAEQRPLGTYPLRLSTEVVHSVADRIHPAYHEKIQVTDAFLPFSRIDAQAQYQRFPFDDLMFRVGQIYFTFDVQENWSDKTLISHTLKEVTIQDPLEEFKDRFKACYDIRTGKIVRSQEKSSYEGEHTEEIVNSPEFIEIIAQIKFFDGRLSGYSAAELTVLSSWLEKNDSEQMKDHLLNEILRYRQNDKSRFAGSQLEQLFDDLQQESGKAAD